MWFASIAFVVSVVLSAAIGNGSRTLMTVAAIANLFLVLGMFGFLDTCVGSMDWFIGCESIVFALFAPPWSQQRTVVVRVVLCAAWAAACVLGWRHPPYEAVFAVAVATYSKLWSINLANALQRAWTGYVGAPDFITLIFLFSAITLAPHSLSSRCFFCTDAFSSCRPRTLGAPRWM